MQILNYPALQKVKQLLQLLFNMTGEKQHKEETVVWITNEWPEKAQTRTFAQQLGSQAQIVSSALKVDLQKQHRVASLSATQIDK